jgi:hypothetical protein
MKILRLQKTPVPNTIMVTYRHWFFVREEVVTQNYMGTKWISPNGREFYGRFSLSSSSGINTVLNSFNLQTETQELTMSGKEWD